MFWFPEAAITKYHKQVLKTPEIDCFPVLEPQRLKSRISNENKDFYTYQKRLNYSAKKKQGNQVLTYATTWWLSKPLRKQKKPKIKGHVIYTFTCTQIQNRSIHSSKSALVVGRQREEREWRFLWWWWKYLELGRGGSCTTENALSSAELGTETVRQGVSCYMTSTSLKK